MEDEKKKKRNKKKKNKQSKAAEDVAVDAEETSSLDRNHLSKDDHGQIDSGASDAHNDVENMNPGLVGHRPNGTEGSILLEAERQQWLHREATLEETIRQLRSESDLHIKKEVSLEETVQVIQNENALYLEKEATLQETIKQLQSENNLYSQKQAGLEMIVLQLQKERDSLLQKEDYFEGKINQLLDEKASLEEKVRHLEGEKDIWILKENSTQETIASLNGDAAKLREQVVELEEFRSGLLQESQRMTEIISGLQSQILNFERNISSTSSNEHKLASEHKELNSQMEAALALVEKLMSENVELVEKVNQLQVQLEKHATTGLPSACQSDQMIETAVTTSAAHAMSESYENLYVPSKKAESVEIIPVKEENIGSDNVDVELAAAIPSSLPSDERGEIVQISLDENEIQDVELQAAANDEKASVPISDAPLIGAPFRLMSFVAKYVSGADLVNEGSS